MKEIAFIASGPLAFASSRLRVYWVAKHMENCVIQEYNNVMQYMQIRDAEIYIFQKSISPDLAAECKKRGAQVWWDVCDPVWWWEPALSKELSGIVDGVVVSNPGLADEWERFAGYPAHVIPDRLDLDHFDRQREHHDTSPVRFIWFGLGCNRVALASIWANLVQLITAGYPITLTIMDNMPDKSAAPMLGYELPIGYVRWELDAEVRLIAQHDVALLPPYPGPWGKVKSNNKTQTALACGVPVTDGFDLDELIKLVTDWEHRSARGSFPLVDVAQSAADWKELLGL